MILVLDNYDSFVFNVVRYFEELGRRSGSCAATRWTFPASARWRPTPW